MSSIPPPARRSTPPPHLRLTGAVGQTHLCFSLEGAPPQACLTRTWRHGIEFDTTVAGQVTAVSPQGLDLLVGESMVALRHLLPDGLDLGPLLEHWLVIRLAERFESGRWTRQLEIRDLHGRALLIARDGQLPRDGEVLGLTMRVSLDVDAARLALGRPPHLDRVDSGALRRVQVSGQPMDLLVVRVGAEDVAMLWVAR